MNGGVHPIVVGVDGSAAGAVAQRRAMAEAIAHQLAVRTHGQHAATGTLLGSVSQGVLHHAACPVAVVPLRP